MADNDVDALARVRAFEDVLRDADSSIRYVIGRLVGAETDDVLQAAYLKAFRAWPAFRGESTAATWLHRVAYTTAIDHLRSRQRRPSTVPAHDDAADRPLVADIAVGVSERLDLAGALTRLSAEQRAVLLLVDGQARTHAEAAQILGVPSGTIASRVHRARLTMRALLSVGSEV